MRTFLSRIGIVALITAVWFYTLLVSWRLCEGLDDGTIVAILVTLTGIFVMFAVLCGEELSKRGKQI